MSRLRNTAQLRRGWPGLYRREAPVEWWRLRRRSTVASAAPPAPATRPPKARRGLTLIELMFAMLITAMAVGALAAASHGVHLANEYGQGYGTATQHARVALERIARTVGEAYATVDYPGVWVTQDTDGSWTFPDTVVIWHPAGAPANANGPPLVQELVVFCPDPAAPGDLVMLTAPGDTRQVPATDATALKSLIDGLKSSSSTTKVMLSDLLRVVASPSSTTNRRAAVRFVVTVTPSAADWAKYTAGQVGWNNLNWPLGLSGSKKGLRQVWLRSEIQLMPGVTWAIGNPAGEVPVPFLGSATLSYSIP